MRGNVADHGGAFLHRLREFRFRGQGVIDADSGDFRPGGVFAGEAVMRVDRGPDPAAAMEEHREAGAAAQFLDSYLYASFEPGGIPLTVKLGRQLVNWGVLYFAYSVLLVPLIFPL